MIKPLIIIFNTVSIFLFSFFFGDSPVSISGSFPKNIKIATEVIAEIKINKNNIGGFAKLQLEVPQGVTVKELESKTGNFTFANNVAKIIWTAMPSDPEFTVKFTLSADATASGAKTITAKFSYVNNNVKEVVEMTPSEIIIGDGTSEPIANTTQTTNSTSAEVVTSNALATSSPVVINDNNFGVLCSRVITSGASANTHDVEIKIKKGSIKGFAKYQEALPDGFSAKAGKTNGSSFSIADGKIKFVWVSLPTDEELVISYTLEKNDLSKSDSKLDNGEFSYLENDQSKKVKMSIDAIDNKQSSDVAKAEIVTQTPTVASEPTEKPVVAVEPSKSDEPVKVEPVKLDTKTEAPKGNSKIAYNVQIGAFKNAIQPEVLAKKFSISENIKSEMAEGFSKFMVGNFNEYKDAHSHREIIKEKGCRSAFVVAYNGAKRITVQEALMITNQKWFK